MATSIINAPVARYRSHGSVDRQRNDRLGRSDRVNLQSTNTGGRYCAQSGPSPTPTPTPTASPSATRDTNGYFNANSNSYGYSHSQSNTDWNANRNPYWNTDNNSNAK